MTENPRSGWQITPQVVFGLAIVFFGLVLTAGNLGFGSYTHVIRFWPMVFTLAGLGMLLERGPSSSRRTFGLILLVVGLWWTANLAFGINLYLDDWWPVLLVVLGAFLVLRAIQRPTEAEPQTSTGGIPGGSGLAADRDTREDVISSFAFMSGVRRNVFSTNFRRANLTAIMGGVELDLRQAAVTGGESIVEVFAIWGGIVIRVPADWQVVQEVTPIMGGVDDRSMNAQPARHRLVIRGAVLMGGVEVKS